MHQNLVGELLKENDLYGVANALYQHTQLPVLIESENVEILAVAGMSEEEGRTFSSQLSQLMNNKKKKGCKSTNSNESIE